MVYFAASAPLLLRLWHISLLLFRLCGHYVPACIVYARASTFCGVCSAVTTAWNYVFACSSQSTTFAGAWVCADERWTAALLGMVPGLMHRRLKSLKTLNIQRNVRELLHTTNDVYEDTNG
eukprot:9131345-Heterocapsa_arctica.AAC.1